MRVVQLEQILNISEMSGKDYLTEGKQLIVN